MNHYLTDCDCSHQWGFNSPALRSGCFELVSETLGKCLKPFLHSPQMIAVLLRCTELEIQDEAEVTLIRPWVKCSRILGVRRAFNQWTSSEELSFRSEGKLLLDMDTHTQRRVGCWEELMQHRFEGTEGLWLDASDTGRFVVLGWFVWQWIFLTVVVQTRKYYLTYIQYAVCCMCVIVLHLPKHTQTHTRVFALGNVTESRKCGEADTHTHTSLNNRWLIVVSMQFTGIFKSSTGGKHLLKSQSHSHG